MQYTQQCSSGQFDQFFLVTLSHDNMENFYQMNFVLMHHHKYSLTELENMMPWEREIYIALLKQHLDKINSQ
jgi:hypothetical protein